MAAPNSGDLASEKLGFMLSRTMNVSCCQIKIGIVMRKSMEDKDKSNWVRRASSVPKNAIKEGEFILSCDSN